jgi:hypothetical protein
MRIIQDSSESSGQVGRPQKYPWNEWLQEGVKIRIYSGEDFDVEPSSLRPQIHMTVKRRGGKVHTSIGREEGKVYIEITYKAGPRPATADDFNFDDLTAE